MKYQTFLLSLLLFSDFFFESKAQSLTLQDDVSGGGYDFSLSYADFEKHALLAKNEVWVVDFWASWCRPCIEALPDLKAIRKKFEGKKVRFVSVSWDKSEENWRQAINAYELTWTHILIPDLTNTPFVDKKFKHKSIPTVFIIDPTGKTRKVSDLVFLEGMVKSALSKLK